MENAVTIAPDDREVFRRVWQRVMPEGSGDGPIVVEAAVIGGDVPCACGCVCPAMGAAALPAVRDEGGDRPETDGPNAAGPCLEESARRHTGQLQQQVKQALEGWQLYRQLARKSGGGACGKLLTELAGAEQRMARRLAAVCFLISGVRFWPGQTAAPAVGSYFGAIRAAFRREQQREQGFLLAAADTEDEMLRELYQELAGQCREHGRTLCTVLEQSRL